MESRWNLSGIFLRIHHIAARRQSPRVHKHNVRPSAIPRTNYLHVDVQWTSYGELQTMNRNAMLTPTSSLCVQEDSHQEDGHSSDLDLERSGMVFCSYSTTRRMGQSRRTDDDQIQ